MDHYVKDYKHKMSVDLSDLKRANFPAHISQGLRKLEESVLVPPNPHIHNTQQHIIDEYILCFRDCNTSKSPKNLNAVDSLVMVRELADYLARTGDPGTRNKLFITLFRPGTSNDPRTSHRLHILASLVSLAVATHNVAVLEATAVWMQQMCCLSVWCGGVCHGLVQDYFHGGSTAPSHFTMALQALPASTPLFTANLITSIAQLFAKLGSPEPCTKPPRPLLEMIVWWLKNNSSLGICPLTHSLPGVSLPMTAVPPLTPLIKWVVEAPFNATPESEVKLRGSVIKEDYRTETDLYSELHLSLLHALQTVPSLWPQITQRQVLCPKHMTGIIEGVCRRSEQSCTSNESLQTSLNRLAQIILVALNTQCLNGALNEMWNAIRHLPGQNRLIKNLVASEGH